MSAGYLAMQGIFRVRGILKFTQMFPNVALQAKFAWLSGGWGGFKYTGIYKGVPFLHDSAIPNSCFVVSPIPNATIFPRGDGWTQPSPWGKTRLPPWGKISERKSRIFYILDTAVSVRQDFLRRRGCICKTIVAWNWWDVGIFDLRGFWERLLDVYTKRDSTQRYIQHIWLMLVWWRARTGLTNTMRGERRKTAAKKSSHWHRNRDPLRLRASGKVLTLCRWRSHDGTLYPGCCYTG